MKVSHQSSCKSSVSSRKAGRTSRLWWPALLIVLGLAGGTQLLARLLPAPATSGSTSASIPPFSLTDQEGQVVTNQTLAGKLYVTDFFFATCPSVCPRMQSQLHRVYLRYQGDPRIAFLSHTIDPAHDSVPVLRDYAHRLGVADAQQWHFVTGPHDTVFSLAESYLTVAGYDQPKAGNLIHSGTLALVNQWGHVLSTYDGLNPQEVNKLLQHLNKLLPQSTP